MLTIFLLQIFLEIMISSQVLLFLVGFTANLSLLEAMNYQTYYQSRLQSGNGNKIIKLLDSNILIFVSVQVSVQDKIFYKVATPTHVVPMPSAQCQMEGQFVRV